MDADRLALPIPVSRCHILPLVIMVEAELIDATYGGMELHGYAERYGPIRSVNSDLV